MKISKFFSSIALIAVISGNPSQATSIDIAGYEEMAPDAFLELAAGKKISGTLSGREIVETYALDKSMNGKWGRQYYIGRWEAGENNCLLLKVTISPDTMCWKFLHKEGKYVWAHYNNNGTKLRETTSHLTLSN